MHLLEKKEHDIALACQQNALYYIKELNMELKAYILCSIGLSHLAKDNYQDSIMSYERALEIFIANNMETDEYSTIKLLRGIYLILDNKNKVNEYTKKLQKFSNIWRTTRPR